MTDIPTWHERAMRHPDHQSGMISEGMIRARMGEEIEDLRAEAQRLRAENKRVRAEMIRVSEENRRLREDTGDLRAVIAQLQDDLSSRVMGNEAERLRAFEAAHKQLQAALDIAIRERDEALEEIRCMGLSEALAAHSGSPSREWHSVGAWLYPGETIRHVFRSPREEPEVKS